jgi:hypothetical protein
MGRIVHRKLSEKMAFQIPEDLHQFGLRRLELPDYMGFALVGRGPKAIVGHAVTINVAADLPKPRSRCPSEPREFVDRIDFAHEIASLLIPTV